MKGSKGLADLAERKLSCSEHIANYFRAISMMFHEPASDKMNTNKLVG